MQAFPRRGCIPPRALAVLARLRAERCFFRGTRPQKRDLTSFRHLRMTELCEATRIMASQKKLFQQSDLNIQRAPFSLPAAGGVIHAEVAVRLAMPAAFAARIGSRAYACRAKNSS